MINLNKPKFRYALGSFLALGVGMSAYAQDDSSDEEEIFELSPFEVSADDDKVYRAGATLAGSRLATSLEETPVALSVMTEQFLDDIGADNVNESMVYGLNAGNDIGGGATDAGAVTGNGLVGNEFNFQIRGYRNVAATRDYFPTLIASDSFNLERVEVARGPNSLIFGIGGPGGVVNIQAKRASTQSEDHEIGAKFGSYGLQRYTLDTNQVLIEDKLGVRFNYLNQQKDGWKDFAKDDQERYALAATFRPTDSTTLRFGLEMGELDQNRARPWQPVDGVTQWEFNGSHYFDYGTPESPWTDGDDNYTQKRDNLPQAGWWGFGINPDSNGLPDFWTPDNPDQFERRSHHLGTPTILMTTGPLAGKYIEVGTRQLGQRYYRKSGGAVNVFDIPQFYNDPSLPRNLNPGGSGEGQFNDYETYGFSIDQRIGQKLNINLTMNESTNDRRHRSTLGFNGILFNKDIMSTLPTFNNDGTYDATLILDHPERGEPGPGIGTMIFDSLINNPMQDMAIMTSYPQETNRTQKQEDMRVTASYDLDLGDRAGQHTLMAFAQRSTTSSFYEQSRETNVSPNRSRTDQIFNGTDYPGRSFHVDYFSPNLADRGMPDPWTTPLPKSILWGADPSLGHEFEAGFRVQNTGYSEYEIDSMAFAVQSRLLNDRLITTAGIRRDDPSASGRAAARSETMPDEILGLGEAWTSPLDGDDTYSVGLVYQVPGADWLRVFANKSTNFMTQNGAKRFEDELVRESMEIGPLKGNGRDVGVKVNVNDRVYATVAYYETSQDNAVTGLSSGNVPIYINAIWTAIDNAAAGRTDPSDPLWETDLENPLGHHVGGSETKSQASSGIEFELVANPVDNWRISFNYSDGETTTANLGTGLEAYMAKHRDTWMANASLNYDFESQPGFLGDNTVGDLVNGLDGFLTFTKASEGLGEVNHRPKNANLFTAYSFSDGNFKGLTVGAGVNYKGDAILGVDPGSVENPNPRTFWGGSYAIYNAMASYEFKWGESDVRLQLNVNNALENDDEQVLGSRYYPDLDEVKSFYYFLEPRSYTISANISF
ncbi:TonB-dependent siderophore receptor [Pelagicoccus mobilis]|uniref:TonB-dependent receptor plug domain-containing protein n=1 Tax=Pelagicoccus mobilis TaxID=415221 RepID=A0A934S024_9BACT|nr:TonB-dependent receptor plug domain-containing protein [Pelagicoccus mobilis]MBK1878504.1 TonB-dependent receptor plug domain-containing protein [Pelagicoccus mobilis]